MSNYKFVYLRQAPTPSNKKGEPVGCVAFTLDGDVLNFGVSVQHPSDAFDVKKAKGLALQRLIKAPNPSTFKSETDPVDSNVVIHHVMTLLVSTSGLPTRARKAAKMWLRTKRHFDSV
jgi:hypothetical protein